MEKIKRYEIIKKLLLLQNDRKIKVLTGPFGSGKSSILDSLVSQIHEIDEDCNVIEINYRNLKQQNVNNSKKLVRYISNRIKDGNVNIAIIKEIDFIKNCASALMQLYEIPNLDVYVTSSFNIVETEKFDVYLKDKFIEIKILPFSFKEFIKINNSNKNYDEQFDNYCRVGGLPGSFEFKQDENRKKYLSNLLEEHGVNDLVKKYGVTNPRAVKHIIFNLIYNLSEPVSSHKICDALEDIGLPIDHKTVGKYINYLVNSEIFYKVKRYNINKKSVISSNFKYYLSDQGQIFSRDIDAKLANEKIYDNIVYLELLRKGYEIYAGVTYNSHVDFIAIKDNEKLYVQVADDISDQEVYEKEMLGLKQVRDCYPKILLARTHQPVKDVDGIKIIDIVEWLLNY